MPTVAKTTIRDSIDTVRNQSNGDWRLIVGGDGHIPDLDYDDDRISIVGLNRVADAGIMRNRLAQLVKTEWVGFLDDDDEIHPDYVQYVVDNKDSCDVIIFQMDNYGNIIPKNSELKFGHVGISFAMKTEFLLRHPFDRDGNGEDFRMLDTLRKEGYRMHFANWCAYYVRPYLNR